MIVLVMGGSGSGKSEFAESICMKLPAHKKRYIATMQAYDEESHARVKKHRKARSGKGFETIEQGTHMEDICLPQECTALLECMSNLVANEVFAPDGRGYSCEEVLKEGLHYLAGQAKHLVIVSNDIFSDGVEYDPETEQYLKILGQLNQEAAAMADCVFEVVCGIPICIKGKEYDRTVVTRSVRV
ncbi:bifunctional adenosylcobinamide kinase/adenosylcobinamide-phosphate guanylyltransferase [uncultured Eubacterium sp.]|uniref:bifunctional adenosylcobinamide kinase/adenosylcobinamide-phosphate guanylyltransferase n=1 Tax=uncultured Eubacterium sp. TaxID=165185 RepID=UPI0025FA43D1|nr:bifunctional adenosylcobinamide kinase/adenosylcobinamide-phosphate guanylyltransferase [uncultured Eubacterium sp.]